VSVAAPLALLGIAAVWGWTFVLVKEVVVDTPPLTFLAARFAVAFVLLAVLLRRRLRGTGQRELVAGTMIGAALFVGYLFQTWGLRHTSASKSGLITGLYVVLVPVLAAAFARRRESAAVWGGVALAAAGLVFLVVGGAGLGHGVNLGDLLTLACAVGFAAHILLVDDAVRRLDYLKLLVIQIGVVALLSLFGALALERGPVAVDAQLVLGVAVTGVAATALALYVMNRFQTLSTASYTAILLATEPLFAALFGALLLGERLRAAQWAGAALIVVGVLVPRLGGSGRASAVLRGEDQRHAGEGDRCPKDGA